MTRASRLSSDNILRFLQLQKTARSWQELMRGLRIPSRETRALRKMLDRLKSRQLIRELPDGRYILSSQKSSQKLPSPQKSLPRGISGRLILHQEGYGFVVPDEP